jgi:hypothetical protein
VIIAADSKYQSLMECYQNLWWETIAEPLAHDGKAVRMAERTDECGCIAMSLLKRS